MKALEPYNMMLEGNFRIAYLIAHFIMEDLSEEEEEELENWILQSDQNMKVFEDLTDEVSIDQYLKWYFEQDIDQHLNQVKKRIQFKGNNKVFSLLRYVAAASIVFLILAGGYYFLLKNTPTETSISRLDSKDIEPGKVSAMLKLANGKIINLANLRDTIINKEVRIENGIVIYSKVSIEPEMHEITIPRKGFYSLVLPDGSKAWVNSSSSIRYPSGFTGNERRVTVTGETYFEVAKDALHPFIVEVNGIDITALGTAFNVNAYPEEDNLRISLTEGKIKVSNELKTEALQPGQQVVIKNNKWSIEEMDAVQVTAWTKNQFRFKNQTIEEIMRMVERWYDAQIIYQDTITKHFTGTIDRNLPVSKILQLLEATGEVKFQIEGNTITVSR